MPKMIDSNTKKLIVQLYSRGMTLNEVANMTCVSPSTVYNVVTENGVSKRKQGRRSGLTQEQKMAADEWAKGCGCLATIAEEHGVTAGTVGRWAKAYGVAPKINGEWKPRNPRTIALCKAIAKGDKSFSQIAREFGVSRQNVYIHNDTHKEYIKHLRQELAKNS